MPGKTEPPRIVIPYYTGKGHTRVLAEAVAEGAGGARLIDVEKMGAAEWQALDEAEAMIFGAPTYFGSTASGFDHHLIEAVLGRWPEMAWRDKLAGGFTVATYASGDKLSALTRLAVFAAQMGMVWVGQAEIGAPVHPGRGPLKSAGSWLGLTASSSRDKRRMVPEEDLETARLYGARMAAAALRWRQG